MTEFSWNSGASKYPNLEAVSASLPALPKTFKFLDDYTGSVRSVDTLSSVWHIRVDGQNAYVDWSALPSITIPLIRFWLIWIANSYDASTLVKIPNFISRRSADIGDLLEQVLISPAAANEYWHSTVITSGWSMSDRVVCKLLLRCLCLNILGPWAPSYFDSIRQWPLGIRVVKPSYSDAIDMALSHQEEMRLLDYIDEISTRIDVPDSIDVTTLRSVCILICCYQFGPRPIQIASLDTSDIKCRVMGRGKKPAIHVRFARAKQRRGEQRVSMLRKVKDEWTGIFALYTERRLDAPDSFVTDQERPNSYFCLTPSAISQLIVAVSQSIIGRDASANNYRHTAAQRLVDAGASEVELAEFLGHSDIASSLTYFDGSPSQAARINTALGLSPIYSALSPNLGSPEIRVSGILL